MNELQGLGVGSILVSSGTLSPILSFGEELGLRFPNVLENKHVVNPRNIHVSIVGSGATGRELNSSFIQRQKTEYYMELGKTLVGLIKCIPKGVLVFFPSYANMRRCLEVWGGPVLKAGSTPGEEGRWQSRHRGNRAEDFFTKGVSARARMTHGGEFVFQQQVRTSRTTPTARKTKTQWDAILEHKSVVLEPTKASGLKFAVSEYRRLLHTPHGAGNGNNTTAGGCIFMGVCRGKISEGIDFAGDQSRGVIVTGIPFAPAMEPKVKLKREYLDRLSKESEPSGEDLCGGYLPQDKNQAPKKISGEDWYCQQAHRAVNQAIGRVIRSSDDYGAVLLLDSRFGKLKNSGGLSKWIRPFVRRETGYNSAREELSEFFSRMARDSNENKRPATTRSTEGDQELLPSNKKVITNPYIRRKTF